MNIPPEYEITPEIKKLNSLIEELRAFLNSVNAKPEIINKLNQLNKLKSAFYSAKIDGNTLTWEQIKEEFIKRSQNEHIILPPRQEEILAIIKDHMNVSFDFIQRRFYKVPARTLRYDLKKLAEKGLVIKVGITRGSFYRAK
ncbi:hypothetical protein A3D78_06000 [Candidatus Gottesmanbacteria bacterium RIFCSPHIGHO2_02_FULL_39_14]|uniref:HTH deoR-type domain-containing protein n=2 Tax=Candidatus Gottesmaniibacteriota TaxID=1752720 RepID=A0A1F5ZYH6_9BACT|nr:MAG: hypothetical protein A2153_00560 [Candidatus Gottesmanbacteria bacterium RBG_16_38_7b]OGG17405.1 MAG: hypothetical protein A3D78_06000 [Candidatus Gottesmanbacteria bacterium RIFCSPHIGHO2_02_FULL_39_14]